MCIFELLNYELTSAHSAKKKNESYVEELGSCFNNLKYGRIILRILLIIG